jgi:hypothetical protein
MGGSVYRESQSDEEFVAAQNCDREMPPRFQQAAGCEVQCDGHDDGSWRGARREVDIVDFRAARGGAGADQRVPRGEIMQRSRVFQSLPGNQRTERIHHVKFDPLRPRGGLIQ